MLSATEEEMRESSMVCADKEKAEGRELRPVKAIKVHCYTSGEPPGLPELVTLVRPNRSWPWRERRSSPEDTNTCGGGEYSPCSEGNSLRFISTSFLKTTTRRENSVLSRRTGTAGKRRDVPCVGRTGRG